MADLSVTRALGAFVAAGSAVLVFACSSTTTGDGSSGSSGSTGSSGTGASGGSSAVPANCASDCTARASQCGQPSARCTQLCASITGAQYACIQGAGCDQEKAADCLEGGGSSSGSSGSSSGSSGSSSGSSGSTACIQLGKTGCSSLNAPSGCCDVSGLQVVCNGNNDGKGNSQCCVNQGNTCKADADCCGNAANPTITKCCAGTKKCGTGC
jgi:hypothetical protein